MGTYRRRTAAIARNASRCTAFARSASACNCICIARWRVRCSGSSGAACCCAQAQNTGAMTVVVGEFLRGALPILYPMVQVRKKLVHDWKSNLVVGFEMLALDGCPHCFGRDVSAHLFWCDAQARILSLEYPTLEHGATERSWQVHVPDQIAPRRGPLLSLRT